MYEGPSTSLAVQRQTYDTETVLTFDVLIISALAAYCLFMFLFKYFSNTFHPFASSLCT